MKPSTIMLLIIAVGACTAGAWLFVTTRTPVPPSGASPHTAEFFKPPQDYKTTGGQQMKPRW
ncbi:entry exclusion protein TrbK [Roseixanthobacter glucoisosaccharinicivorans]|uniref:entry exclusion protein TrbK n=1 Tax=Roseixanthobacter glucoisosaccharinicivorans TaxID=3119923 RepID=UPI00372B3779